MSRRGGERTIEEISRLFPSSAISTLFCDRRTLPGEFASKELQVSPLGHLAPRFCDHRTLLPLYPWAVRRLRVPAGTRLVVSSDAALTKGLRVPRGCLHVCYCHSPPRYLWEMSQDYVRQTSSLGWFGRLVFRWLTPRLRAFDRAAAGRVDHFIANSRFVADRIKHSYGRQAVVVNPPVQTARFSPTGKPGDYYLVVSELVSYKRVDLAVKACGRDRKLVIAGHGPEANQLKAAAGSNVSFLGRVSDEEISSLMGGCTAFLHPQIEDFGIAAVEAQAAGRPVIAFRGGGALETVVEGKTGLFFDEQTSGSLGRTLEQFESMRATWSQDACRRNAELFCPEVFRRELSRVLVDLLPESAAWMDPQAR